ncbi:mechanosensitive ion channel family protein [candidate division KSB1 bacterium]|nr:mechanosensitive ion channel family protein [candidate division KSB1 bacterium]
MLKYFSFILCLLFCRATPAFSMQDTSKQVIVPTDSLIKAVGTVDSIKAQVTAVDSSDTTVTKAKKSQIRIDSSASRDTTMSVSRADSLPAPTAKAQSVAVDSLEESKQQEIETTVELPQTVDTATAAPPALTPSLADTTAAAKVVGDTSRSAEGKTQPETLPRSISEEATSAEENILRQLEGLASIFSLPRIILTLIVFFVTYFVAKIVTIFLTRIAKRRARLAPKLRKAIPLVSFGLWFFAAYLVIVGIFARSPLSIAIIMAVLALAFFFASRQLLQDIVGGLVILFERPFHIGDRIRIGGHYGEVAKIGLRAFRLLAPDGSVVVIPNAEVMRQSIANANPGKTESLVAAELLLPANVDIEAARKIAFEAAAVSPFVYIKKPIEVQVDEEYRDELLTKLLVKAYVFDARYERELRSHIITQARKGLQHQIEKSFNNRFKTKLLN